MELCLVRWVDEPWDRYDDDDDDDDDVDDEEPRLLLLLLERVIDR